MTKQTKMLLTVGGVAAVGYLLWKQGVFSSKKSNFRGGSTSRMRTGCEVYAGGAGDLAVGMVLASWAGHDERGIVASITPPSQNNPGSYVVCPLGQTSAMPVKTII